MVNHMNMNTKQDRQRKVLELIVRYHISTAEPVGSSVIARDMALSSATIRNIMFELEEMGLIKQPHTSAGRMPSEKGYRAYVDMLMESETFSTPESAPGSDTIGSLMSDSIEHILINGLELCSNVTSQTCIAFLPTAKIRERFNEQREDHIHDSISSLYDFEDRLYLGGAHYLVEHPEFRESAKIAAVLRLLENKKGLLDLLEEDVKLSGIRIYIGSENRGLGFDECSLITANYSVGDDINGTLGIIGPMRMEYERLIPALADITCSMTSLLRDIV